MVGFPLLGKKKVTPAVPAVERVKVLSNQGFSEPEIIRTLRREGYSPVEVDRAIKSAIRDTAAPDFLSPMGELPTAGEPFRGGRYLEREPFAPPVPEAPLPPSLPLPKPGEETFDLPPLPGMAEQKPVGTPSMIPSPLDMEIKPEPRRRSLAEIPKLHTLHEERSIERGEIEEIIEGIIEEKWDLVERELGEFEERVKDLDEKIRTLEEHVNLLREKRREDQEDVKASVVAYKEAVGELSMKIEAIERAMKDSLSPMLQTLRSLSDAIKTMKER